MALYLERWTTTADGNVKSSDRQSWQIPTIQSRSGSRAPASSDGLPSTPVALWLPSLLSL
jgi:hypothetical protein